MISDFSDEGPDVTLVAPADHHQRVPGPQGSEFGGTSGATPLVSAAVADIKSVLGPLGGKQAAKILQLSSTKLPVGVGQLNSFRAFQLALKLKARGWPANSHTLLEEAQTWNFKEEAKEELLRAKQILNGSTCADLKLAFLALRKSFLLDESNSEVKNLLAQFYESQGYPVEAQYLRNFERPTFKGFLANSGVLEGDCSFPGFECQSSNTASMVVPFAAAVERAQSTMGYRSNRQPAETPDIPTEKKRPSKKK